MEKIINGRKHVLCWCKNCGKSRWKRKSHLQENPNTFCDPKCKGLWSRLGKDFHCANCGKLGYRRRPDIAKSKSGDFFCSQGCAAKVNNKRYRAGKNNVNWVDDGGQYRKKALLAHGETCMNPDCPLTFKYTVSMVDVHHIDGDRKNGKMENLIVLCVWCHGLVTRKLLDV